jgi:hypothetical protein
VPVAAKKYAPANFGQTRLKALGQKKCATSLPDGVAHDVRDCFLFRFNLIEALRIVKNTPRNAQTISCRTNDLCAVAACVSIARPMRARKSRGKAVGTRDAAGCTAASNDDGGP